jgi:hypothetical protein
MRSLGVSVTHLMDWETPSNRCTASGSLQRLGQRSSSLNILPLGVLLDRFHLHNASDQRDKVYALLGVHLASTTTTNLLLPDYTDSWRDVFSAVIKYLLGPSVAVSTWDGCEQAVITGSGCPLGKVTGIESNRITIDSTHFASPRDENNSWRAWCTVATHCKDIALGDVLWQMNGADYPSVIRFCGCHFDIVAISMPISDLYMYCEQAKPKPWQSLSPQSYTYTPQLPPAPWRFPHSWQERHNALSNGSRQITVIWDWAPIAQQSSEDHVEPLSLASKTNFQPSSGLRLSNCARILDDLLEHDKLKGLIKDDMQLSDDPMVRRHFQLLDIICSQWKSYTWLKTRIEELRWSLHRLEGGLEHILQHPASSSHLLEYWKDEGCLAFDVSQIDALSRIVLQPVVPVSVPTGRHEVPQWAWEMRHKRMTCFDWADDVLPYGDKENDHRELLSALLPGYEKSSDNTETPTHEGKRWNGRYLTRLILAQKDFRPTGSRCLPK